MMVEEIEYSGNKKVCIIDPTHKTYIHKKYGTERWFKYKDGYICKKCYQRLINNPRRTKEYIKKYNDRRDKDFWRKHPKTPEQNQYWNSFRVKFKDKILRAKEPIIRDKCDWCGNKKGDQYINCKGEIATVKYIHKHHLKYHEDEPTKDTINLCASCHMKETRRLEKLVKHRYTM